jgi:glycosyltransferase involved in cell wall biosynthesis
MKNILLFIPTYNCSKQISRVIEKLPPTLFLHVKEILLVDNNSSDETREVAQKSLASLRGIKATLLKNNNNYSLGGSMKVAILYAQKNGFSHLMVLHGDDQADARDLLPYLESGVAFQSDLFIGARFHPQSRLLGYSKFRTFGNKVLNYFLSFITRTQVHDMIAGLNVYNLSIFDGNWFLNLPDNLTFDPHVLLYALDKKLKVYFFPISWREEDQQSNAKVFKQAWILFKLFVKYMFLGGKIFAVQTPQKLSSVSYDSTVEYSQNLRSANS